MKYSNDKGLPETLVRGVQRQNAKYDKGKAHISVTQMITSPRINALRKQHFREMEKDISEEWWSLFGSAVHYILELGADHNETPEERLFLQVNGWTISGAVDLQTKIEGGIKLSDYKVTTAYPIMGGKVKFEWEAQVNIGAYLIRANKGEEVLEAEIVAIVRDWDRNSAVIDPNYPASPVTPLPVRLWTLEEQEAYIFDRVLLHQNTEMGTDFGDDLPECSPEERWSKPDKYAVWKEGNKKPSKVLPTEDEAIAFIEEQEKKKSMKDAVFRVEVRPGESTRCAGSYCGVSKWCTQWHRIKAEMEAGRNDGDVEANPEL